MDRLAYEQGRFIEGLQQGLWVIMYDYDDGGGSVSWNEYYSDGVLEGEGICYEH